jgi:hypothetical protein
MAKKTVEKKAVEKRNIHQRINAVMRKANFIHKGKEIKNAKGTVMYTVAGHDEVTKKIHPLLVEQGINIIPECIAMVQEGSNRVRVDMEYTWVNIDDPEDCIVKKWSAFGMDMQHDKAVGKAYSYAQRLMTLKTLHIQSGDNDEVPIEDCEDGDEEYEPTAALTSVTSVALQAAADELGDQGIPAIGRPKANGKTPTLTATQKKAFVQHVMDNNVTQTEAVSLLKKHKYAKTADIPQNRLGFFKSEITRISKEQKRSKDAGQIQ